MNVIGTTLGHYEILEALGAGGMGEVYRARDTKLDRDVAIKVLPEDFATDVERLARFTREAKLLATLNHPNIAGVYGHEDEGDQRYIAMELVEGETLAERIARAGRMEVDEALEIARQIAEALQAAHDNGIIHRDLKPANVKVTPDGKVKVLDFGLARAPHAESSPAETEQQLSHSPTMTAATRVGAILGTAAYMSPEQARGKPVDKRADIWAFGAVLYELLAASKAFAGETATDVLASVVKEAPDWTELPRGTPPALQTLLARCLRKDPRRRLHDIADARIEIEEMLAALEDGMLAAEFPAAGGRGQAAEFPAASRRGLAWPIAWGLTAAMAFVLGAMLWGARDTKQPARVLRLSITLLQENGLTDLSVTQPIMALSADGSKLVYAGEIGAGRQLFVRKLDSLEVIPLEGTENGHQPFFSPDGEWVGFFAQGNLLKVPSGGGTAVPLAPVSSSWGGTWSSDGTIIYTPTDSTGLWEVDENGGDARQITFLDPVRGDGSHDFPHALPGGDGVLFTIFGGNADERAAAYSRRTGEVTLLFEAPGYLGYLNSGHVVYGEGSRLSTRTFNAADFTFGPPVTVLDGALTDTRSRAAVFAVTASGTLVYVPDDGTTNLRSLTWVDRSGEATPITDEQRQFTDPRISPDGAYLAVIDAGGRANRLLIYEFRRRSFSQPAPGQSIWAPAWFPDSRWLAFSRFGIQRMRADGTGTMEQILPEGFGNARLLTDVSRDGRLLAIRDSHPEGGDNVYVAQASGEGELIPIATSVHREYGGVLSPDGRWVAYVSTESGPSEVYVRSVEGDRKWTISNGGGVGPRWSADGSELFYRRDRKVLVVPVELDPDFQPGLVQELFDGPYAEDDDYDVSPDGQRFLMLEEGSNRANPTELVIVLNWPEELSEAVSPGR